MKNLILVWLLLILLLLVVSRLPAQGTASPAPPVTAAVTTPAPPPAVIKASPLTVEEIREVLALRHAAEESAQAAQPFMQKAQQDAEKRLRRERELLKAHGCDGGSLDAGLVVTNCVKTRSGAAGK